MSDCEREPIGARCSGHLGQGEGERDSGWARSATCWVKSSGVVVAPSVSRFDEFGLGNATGEDVSAEAADGTSATDSASTGTTAASTVARRH